MHSISFNMRESVTRLSSGADPGFCQGPWQGGSKLVAPEISDVAK